MCLSESFVQQHESTGSSSVCPGKDSLKYLMNAMTHWQDRTRAPQLHHFVRVLRPYLFAQSLLPDDANVMALRAGSVNLSLTVPAAQVLLNQRTRSNR